MLTNTDVPPSAQWRQRLCINANICTALNTAMLNIRFAFSSLPNNVAIRILIFVRIMIMKTNTCWVLTATEYLLQDTSWWLRVVD